MFRSLKIVLPMLFLLLDDINNLIGHGNRISVFTQAQCENAQCGFSEVKMINRGYDEDHIENYPFIISLVRTGDYSFNICGGTLISPDFVLTAAHCLQRQDMNPPEKCKSNSIPPECFVQSHEIQVGIVDTKTDSKSMRYVDVKKVIPNPLYKNIDLINDIGLIQLNVTIHCNDQAIPICLPNKDLSKPGDTLKIAGRGKDPSIIGGNKDEKVLEGTVNVLQPQACPFPVSKQRRILCVQGTDPNQSACPGDSGTALFSTYGDQYFALGVTSSGPTECGSGKPNAYTDIFPFMSWIRSYVSNLPKATSEEKPVK